MQMQVVDGHPRRIADIEGQPVAALPDAFDAGDVLRQHEQAREHLGVVPLKLPGIVDVLLGDHQAVDRGAR